MQQSSEQSDLQAALVEQVFCDECPWTGTVQESMDVLGDGWLACPLCLGEQIFEGPQRWTVH